MIILTNLLVIDDDEDDRWFFKEAVTNVHPDVHVSEAADGLQAVDLLISTKTLPQIIFLDLNMPRMDGFQFLTQIKLSSDLAHIPVIILTTSGEAQDKCYKLGAHDYITKPVHIKDLTLELARVLHSFFPYLII